MNHGHQSDGSGSATRTANYPAIIRERAAIEGFKPVSGRNIPILANERVNINADAPVNATRMKIV